MIKKITISKFTRKQLETIFWSSKNEECALLIGKINEECATPHNVCWIENIAPTPGDRYVMQPQQMINILSSTKTVDPKASLDLTAIFHTHPNYPAKPSSIDIGIAERVGIKTVYLIMSKKFNQLQPETILRGYYWNRKNFTEVEIEYQ